MASFDDFIALIRLNVDIYHNARVCGDWVINADAKGHTCFHMVTQDNCQLIVPDIGEWRLSAGDLVIFPRDLPHSMMPCAPQTGKQQHLLIPAAQDKPGTSLVCGKVYFQHSGSERLLDALPNVFVVRQNQFSPWLNGLQELILDESLRISRQTNVIIDRLCELLFAYALRHYMELHEQKTGIFALYSHRQINKAIQAIHDQPALNWQLQALAEIAAMSRTQFAETFKRISGWTVMQYLTWWRMQLAWDDLRSGLSVAQVAENVGYQSEAAFSRAFRKQFTQSAGAVRRGQ
ncbi:MAG: AraC family transcriptional regulator [Pseudomonadales bacterium]|nr:AraC family transcriptional regulator [Pseudomonadales bacterium]